MSKLDTPEHFDFDKIEETEFDKHEMVEKFEEAEILIGRLDCEMRSARLRRSGEDQWSRTSESLSDQRANNPDRQDQSGE